MQNKISTLACGSVIALLLCGNANASVLTIKNDKTVPVEFSIEKGEADLFIIGKTGQADAQVSSVSIPAKQDIKVEVTKNSHNKEVFNLTGKGNVVSLGGTCKNLKLSSDYNIVFIDTPTGTDCKATAKK